MVEPESDSLTHRGGLILAATLRGSAKPSTRIPETADVLRDCAGSPDDISTCRAIASIRYQAEADGALARLFDGM